MDALRSMRRQVEEDARADCIWMDLETRSDDHGMGQDEVCTAHDFMMSVIREVEMTA